MKDMLKTLKLPFMQMCGVLALAAFCALGALLSGCSVKKIEYEKNDKGFSKRLLHDGDIVTIDIMPVDSGVSYYLQTQLFSEMTGVTAKSNLTGGCIGVFSAMSVSHGDTIKFCIDSIK